MFEIPFRVVLTPQVYAACVHAPIGAAQSEFTRVYDLLTGLRQNLVGCKRFPFRFPVLVHTAEGMQRVDLQTTLQHEDSGELTLMVSMPAEEV